MKNKYGFEGYSGIETFSSESKIDKTKIKLLTEGYHAKEISSKKGEEKKPDPNKKYSLYTGNNKKDVKK